MNPPTPELPVWLVPAVLAGAAFWIFVAIRAFRYRDKWAAVIAWGIIGTLALNVLVMLATGAWAFWLIVSEGK